MLNDLRLAFRSLIHAPGFAAVVIGTLALGIGANSAIFSVLNGVLLQRPPFPLMDRLAVVWETDRASGTTREPASIPDYADFQRMTKTFDGVAAFTADDVNVTPGSGDPFRIAAVFASHELLPLLGVRPIAGRTFTAEEDRPEGPRVAIIGEALWEREFGRDAKLASHTIRLDDVPHAIVGVMPRSADFGVLQILSAAAYSRSFADRGRVDVDVWLPLRADPTTASRDNHPIFVVGRLAAGVALPAAQQEMTRIAADLERAYRSNEARGAFVEALGDVVFGPIRPALFLLIAAVGLVLLVACVNVLNLLLARSTVRAREVAVRAALGAGTWRLMRQFMAEGLVFSGLAACAGLLLAEWILDLLLSLAPSSIPRVSNVAIDAAVIGATVAIALAVAAGTGLVSAWQARRLNVQDTLKAATGGTAATGRSRRSVQSALAVVQVVLAVVLTVSAGLLIKSFWQLGRVDPGFRAQGVLKMEFQLPPTRYPQSYSRYPDWPEIRRFQDELLRRVAALPQIDAVAVAGDHPLAAGFTNSFNVVGREAEAKDWPEISVRRVSASYPRVTGLRLLEGRYLRESDGGAGARVGLINETAQRMFFVKQDPIGQQIEFWGTRRTIVGVVGNEKIHGLEKPAPPAVYVPVAQAPIAAGAVLVRLKDEGDAEAVAPAIRSIFREIDPSLAVFGVEPLRRTLAESLGERRFTMLLLASFAGLTLLLAALGVYAVLNYGVARRTGEIGVRMALGAEPASVRRLVMGRALALVAAGVAIGLAAAALLARLLSALLFGVSPSDPLTFAAAPVVLFLTGIVAAYLPARRASKVDPAVALRAE